MGKPTLDQFKKYQAAYDYFNDRLFGGELAPCLLMFREGKKKKNAIVLGHFAWDRWTRGDETCHEISLNPEALARGLKDTMATLVHEMAHQWQCDHGKRPRAGYHDRQWADKMDELGLPPTDTGEPGGKRTGQRMSHTVAAGGAFDRAFRAMPELYALPWTTGAALELAAKPEKEKAKNKLKYTCPGCAANVWGKAELRIVCGECDEPFERAEAE